MIHLEQILQLEQMIHLEQDSYSKFRAEVLSNVHNLFSIRCNDKSLNKIGLANFITIQTSRFLFFQNVITCLSYTADKYLFKVKSRTLY